MKTKFLILTILAFLISPLFAQESEIIDYPHNLQEFYEKLDEAFPDDTVITSESFDDWDYFYSIPYWDFIRDNVVSTKSIEEAVDSAVRDVQTNESDMIIAFGSLSILKDIKEAANKILNS